MDNQKSGFTLWQLLGIFVIIFVIAAILLPVLIPQRDGGRRLSCLSNEKQLGLAIEQYTQDYDANMPSYQFHTVSNNTIGGTGWVGPMYSYIGSIVFLVGVSIMLDYD